MTLHDFVMRVNIMLFEGYSNLGGAEEGAPLWDAILPHGGGEERGVPKSSVADQGGGTPHSLPGWTLDQPHLERM